MVFAEGKNCPHPERAVEKTSAKARAGQNKLEFGYRRCTELSYHLAAPCQRDGNHEDIDGSSGDSERPIRVTNRLGSVPQPNRDAVPPWGQTMLPLFCDFGVDAGYSLIAEIRNNSCCCPIAKTRRRLPIKMPPTKAPWRNTCKLDGPRTAG